MTKQIAVRIPDDDLAALDAAVARGEFRTRTAAVQAAVQMLARAVRDGEIAEEYRRAYGAQPQEEWIGAAGLAQLGEAVRREEAGREPL